MEDEKIVQANQKVVNNQAYWTEGRSRYFSGIFEDLKELKELGVFDGKKVAVVGSWNNITPINEIMRELGIKLTNIADNNPQKQGISRIGIISQSVESLKNEDNLVILIINNHFFKELRNQLLGLEFVENRDFFVVFGGEEQRQICAMRGNIKIGELGWEDCKQRIQVAYESYSIIYEKYGRKPIWLMHPSSLGDLYIFSLFLPTFYGVDSVDKCECVLIVTKNSVRELATILGYKYVEMITLVEAQKHWLVMMKLLGDEIQVKNAVSYGLSNTYQTLRNYSSVNFADSFYRYVFGMKTMPAPIYPQFPRRTKYVARQFEKGGLVKGRTVVISPYAGHFKSNIKPEQWEKLVKKLTEKGFVVCTNCASDDEKPIEGTVAPFIALKDCVEFLEMAGFFVGIRSGFCDLVCMADCKKIVISESGVPAGSDRFFSFNEMGIGKDIVELVDDCINTDKMLQDIYEMIVC